MKNVSHHNLKSYGSTLPIPSRAEYLVTQASRCTDNHHPAATSPLKRSIDIFGSVIGLGVTGLVLIPIAIAIKLDSPGPIFFSQKRCGLGGKTFHIWKFRSMVSNAEKLKSSIRNEASGQMFKNENDPRTTRIGRFLRRTSLDELPQFWNVLRGEMSMVGTRPPTLDEVARYDPHHFLRLRVKPGITEEWQVYGRSLVRNFNDVLALDLRYQRRWSIWYDLKLILQTFSIVFLQKGAY